MENQSGENDSAIVNEHGVITAGYEVVFEFYGKSRSKIIIKVAQFKSKWYDGYDVQGPLFGMASPVSIDHDSYETKEAAIRAAGGMILERIGKHADNYHEYQIMQRALIKYLQTVGQLQLF